MKREAKRRGGVSRPCEQTIGKSVRAPGKFSSKKRMRGNRTGTKRTRLVKGIPGGDMTEEERHVELGIFIAWWKIEGKRDLWSLDDMDDDAYELALAKF